MPASNLQIPGKGNGEKEVAAHENKDELDYMGHQLDLEASTVVNVQKLSADQLEPHAQEEVKEEEEEIENSSGEEKKKEGGEPGEGHPEDKTRKRDEKYDEKHSQK